MLIGISTCFSSTFYLIIIIIFVFVIYYVNRYIEALFLKNIFNYFYNNIFIYYVYRYIDPLFLNIVFYYFNNIFIFLLIGLSTHFSSDLYFIIIINFLFFNCFKYNWKWGKQLGERAKEVQRDVWTSRGASR